MKHLNTFLYLYGRAETCAMCLIIACSLNSAVFDGTGDDIACDASAPPVRSGAAMGNASNLSATSRGIAQEIVDRAIKTFFDYGGDAKPFQRQGGNVYNVMARRAPAFGSNGGVRGSVEPLWSGKRNGIALYFSRLVRPFWDWTVTYSIRTEPEARLGAAGWFDSLGASARELSSGRPGVSWRLRYQLGDLAKLHAPVERLRQFMERNVATLQCESLRSDEDEQETAAANGGGGASQNFVAMQRNQLATASDSSARNQRELEIAKMKERRSLAELYHTTTRCSQALAALRILARPNHGFNKVVSDCIRLDARAVAAGEGPGPGAGASFETVLSSMTFKQLITEERGGKVIRRLLLQLLSRNDNDTDTRALARELMEKCPMFFSSFTELLALGRRFLERAKQYDNQPGKRERQDLLDGALDQYVRATKELEETPDRQFVDVVIQACDEFQEMQYYDGVLQLLLVAAHYIGEGKTKVMPAGWETWGDGWENAEPPAENDSLTDAGGRGAARGAAGRFGDRGGGRRMGSPGGAKQPRRSQAQASERLAARRVNLRIRLYQRVKQLFSYLLSVGQGGNDFLARILVRAQSYEDTMFHHMLYMFLIGEKRQGDFEGLSSPHVKMFLLRMIEKESRKDGGTARNEAMLNTCYESLVSYYKKNDQKRAAALILAQRALSDEISLQDNPMLESRINWLRDAVQLARSSPQAFAVAGDDGIGAETMLDWEESLDVALEQKKIIDNAFVNSGADEELRNKLQRKLLDISVLHKIAKQFSQWALCLSIIACSGSRGDDVKAEVKKNWNRIFRSCLLRLAGGKGAGEDLSAILQQPHRWVKPICDEILEKGRKFHGQARTSKGDFVVPVGYFIQLVEGLLLRFDARMEFEGHLVTTLRDVNITWMELVDSYSRKTVDVDNFLQLVGIQGTVSVPTIGKWKKDLHFLNKISVIINLWLDNVKRNQRPAEINELLSYIGGLREGVRQWKGECDHVQDANVSNYQAEVRAKLNAVEAMLNDFSSTYMNF